MFTRSLPALLALLAILPGAALAQAAASNAQAASAVSAAPATPATPLFDPYVPPAKRLPSSQPPASGAALHEQALRKLQRQFEAATPPQSSTLTKEEARQAGLGYIADHFEQIDRQGHGKVSFEEVKQYMKQRGANIR